MKANKYTCLLCNYSTKKKYNLNRHIDAIHKEKNYKNTNNDIQNVVIENQNVVMENQNVVIENQNVVMENQNVVIDNKCAKCQKILSSKISLTRHFNICKGITNSLECYICHKIFSFSSSKSVHLKKCKIKNQNNSNLSIVPFKENEIIVPKQEIETQINTINNINNINNTLNANTYNINLIYYNKEDNKISFDISHITNDLVYKIITRDETDAFKYFCDKLFENKNNQLIVKKNLRDNYSNVHIGLNFWEKILDEFIYPKIMSNISETMILYIEEHKGTHRKSKIEYIMNYLHIMASNGYSYKNTNDYKRKYKQNIDMLRILFNSFL